MRGPRSLRPSEMNQLSSEKLAKKASLIYPVPSRLQALSMDGIGPKLLFHVPSHDLWFVYLYNAPMDVQLATVKKKLRRAFTAAEKHSFLNRIGGKGKQLPTELRHFLKHQLEKRTDDEVCAYLEALEPHREEGHCIVRLSTSPLSNAAVNENSPGLSPASPWPPFSSSSESPIPPLGLDDPPSPIDSPTPMDCGPPVRHRLFDMDTRVDTDAYSDVGIDSVGVDTDARVVSDTVLNMDSSHSFSNIETEDFTSQAIIDEFLRAVVGAASTAHAMESDLFAMPEDWIGLL